MKSASTVLTLSDADLYEHFRDRGLSDAQAVLHVERRRGQRPAPVPTAPTPNAAQSLLRNAAQTATSGFADEIIGPMMAAHGWGNADSLTNSVRQQREDAFLAHPVAGITGSLAGGVVNPLNYLLGPLTKGLSPAATGGTYGAVLGGAQGLGEGENPGERAVAGAGGAALGLAGGLAGGYAAGKVRTPVRVIWKNLRTAFGRTEQAVVKTLGKDVGPETVLQVQEAAHRAYLQKQGFQPQQIDDLMNTWRAGGKLPAKPPAPPQVPVTERPGETITQVAKNGFEVTGTRATPPAPDTPSFWEQLRGTPVRDMGKGKTLPYYPRGGMAEQSLAPTPIASPPQLAPNQNAAFIEFLKAGVSAGDVPQRVDALEALGVVGPAEKAQLLQMLGTPR